MGEFLKGYLRKMKARGAVLAGYAQDGDSRGVVQACNQTICYRGAGPRC